MMRRTEKPKGNLRRAAVCAALFCAAGLMLGGCGSGADRTGGGESGVSQEVRESENAAGETLRPGDAANREASDAAVFPFRRIACVGDSLTFGFRTPWESYPVFLSALLSGMETDAGAGNGSGAGSGSGADGEMPGGDGVPEAANFGVNGATVTDTDSVFSLCYTGQEAFALLPGYAPDCIAVMLGSNDAKVWEQAEAVFADALGDLLDALEGQCPGAALVLLSPPPSRDGNGFAIPDAVIAEEITGQIAAEAEARGLPFFDVHALFASLPDGGDSLISEDGVHLTAEGARFLADRLAAFLASL